MVVEISTLPALLPTQISNEEWFTPIRLSKRITTIRLSLTHPSDDGDIRPNPQGVKRVRMLPFVVMLLFRLFAFLATCHSYSEALAFSVNKTTTSPKPRSQQTSTLRFTCDWLDVISFRVVQLLAWQALFCVVGAVVCPG